MKAKDICIFCSATRAEAEQPQALVFYWRPRDAAHPNDWCTYGYRHEFPAEPVAPASAVKKRDVKLCVHCGLHPRNPASESSGCDHVYEKEPGVEP